jgi:hypothetical protein
MKCSASHKLSGKKYPFFFYKHNIVANDVLSSKMMFYNCLFLEFNCPITKIKYAHVCLKAQTLCAIWAIITVTAHLLISNIKV